MGTMRYYEMTEEGMISLLLALNEREREFCQGQWDHPNFSNTETYTSFMNDPFIVENQLDQVYYPKLPSDVKPMVTRGIFELEETSMILSNTNISVCKQFNFHFGRFHQMNCFEMVCVMKGDADFYLGKEKIPLGEGDCLIHPPKIPYEFRMHEDAVGLNIVLRNRYVQEQFLKLFKRNPSALRFFENVQEREGTVNYLLFHAQTGKEKINSLLSDMLIEYLFGVKYKAEIMERYFEAVVYQIRKAADDRLETLELSSPTENYYHQIRLYIQDHYRTATLKNAAKDLNLSQQYIARILRTINGRSFHQLVEKERMSRVKDYLTETDYNLEIIAELTGCSSGSYLSKLFHKLEGCTVSEYRERTKL